MEKIAKSNVEMVSIEILHMPKFLVGVRMLRESLWSAEG